MLTVVEERVSLIVMRQLAHVLLVMYCLTANVKTSMNVWNGHATVQQYVKIIRVTLFALVQMA